MNQFQTAFDFLQEEILGMHWLNRLMGRAVEAIGLDPAAPLGGSLQFFLYDTMKIMILLESVKTACGHLDLRVNVEYITNMETIMDYGIMRTPALVVNERVVSAGRVLPPAEVEKLLRG